MRPERITGAAQTFHNLPSHNKVRKLEHAHKTESIAQTKAPALDAKGNTVVIITGPFGAGKDTIVNRLLKDDSLDIAKPVRYTTRDKRQNETNGVDYHFVTREGFEEMRDSKEFIQWDEYNGLYYSTRISSLQDLFDNSQNPIFSIGMDEIDKLKGALNNVQVPHVDIFISPVTRESLKEPGGIDRAVKILEERILKRRREPDHEDRMSKIKRWLNNSYKCRHIVANPNGELEQALKEVVNIIRLLPS